MDVGSEKKSLTAKCFYRNEPNSIGLLQRKASFSRN